ncbi:ABC transporter substrate-binding protein [Psychrosphaera sp. B3R10]|nr:MULTISPECIES: ABC transporter substrate-binding protein [unclassified Psychrosphaera]MBU2881205.1 ABC transporter substrate-binding protein [Psychrosphaera sp. I2R16]MBU2988310.1 ABC transporter substrate-binding protein [Psychrosphaera sp. B3R10]
MKLSTYLFMLVFFSSLSVASPIKTYKIYHDADYSINRDAALAMKIGLLTALSEFDSEPLGYRLEIVEKNHRGNANRSFSHFKQFEKDDDALFVLGGVHSPPYIQHREYINQSRIPLLIPWAAGGPITRYPSDNNWVFRLSIDDSIAGQRIGEYAIGQLQCKKPHLFLEDTQWGKSNYKTISEYLDGKVTYGISWFGWNTKQNTANIEIRNAVVGGSDCIILVSNYTESKHFLKAMALLPKADRVPIVSHWGLTGGDAEELMTKQIKENVTLSFIQSCFGFSGGWQTPFSLDVHARVKKMFPAAIGKKDEVKAQAGFVHAYDLGRIVTQALQQITMTDDMPSNRDKFKSALESIERPIRGLIKEYNKPFTQWRQTKTDAHEALKLENFCMAEFDQFNRIMVLPN